MIIKYHVIAIGSGTPLINFPSQKIYQKTNNLSKVKFIKFINQIYQIYQSKPFNYSLAIYFFTCHLIASVNLFLTSKQSWL